MRTGRPRSQLPKRIRVEVLRRDGWACQRCGTRRNIEIHHRDRNHKNNQLTNLVPLCRDRCHPLADGRFWPSKRFRMQRDEWRQYVRSLSNAAVA